MQDYMILQPAGFVRKVSIRRSYTTSGNLRFHYWNGSRWLPIAADKVVEALANDKPTIC